MPRHWVVSIVWKFSTDGIIPTPVDKPDAPFQTRYIVPGATERHARNTLISAMKAKGYAGDILEVAPESHVLEVAVIKHGREFFYALNDAIIDQTNLRK